MQEIQGKDKFAIIDNNAWDMILGKAGKLPGNLAPEIIEIAKNLGKEFYTGVPQDNYPDELDKYRKEMEENGWDPGEDDEELFELAMHERQYRDYKSGLAKKRFYDELQKLKDEANLPTGTEHPKADPDKKDIASPYMGKIYYNLNYFIEEQEIELGNKVKKGQRICYIESGYTYDEIISEFDGEVDEIFFKHGDIVEKGDVIVRLK